eukprot:362044-Chlamydomonas_euryale.AAC.4
MITQFGTACFTASSRAPRTGNSSEGEGIFARELCLSVVQLLRPPLGATVRRSRGRGSAY